MRAEGVREEVQRRVAVALRQGSSAVETIMTEYHIRSEKDEAETVEAVLGAIAAIENYKPALTQEEVENLAVRIMNGVTGREVERFMPGASKLKEAAIIGAAGLLSPFTIAAYIASPKVRRDFQALGLDVDKKILPIIIVLGALIAPIRAMSALVTIIRGIPTEKREEAVNGLTDKVVKATVGDSGLQVRVAKLMVGAASQIRGIDAERVTKTAIDAAGAKREVIGGAAAATAIHNPKQAAEAVRKAVTPQGLAKIPHAMGRFADRVFVGKDRPRRR